MIIYNPHQTRTFFKLRGSVLPRASLWGCTSSLFALLLKILDSRNVIDIGRWSWIGGNNVYEGFAFVLGFIVVFRASQSYTRYWQAATAVHEMRTQWYEATANLVCFVQSSHKPKELVNEFQHVVLRLFTLLHAMAMEEVASLLDQEFPVLDIEGLEGEDLRILTSPSVQGRKVEVVSQWLKMHVLQAVESGVLSVPAPILTRVFQNLGTGMVKYHEALQVVIWPFPFPYAQIACFLITCHSILTPLVLVQAVDNVVACLIFTFLSVMCVKSMDLTAAELENPFGDDDNDLPTMEMHHELIQDTLLLTNPSTLRVPRLVKEGALLEHDDLVAAGEEHRLSLYEYQKQKKPNLHLHRSNALDSIAASMGLASAQPSKLSSRRSLRTPSKWAQQLRWATQLFPNKGERVAKTLRLDEHGRRIAREGTRCNGIREPQRVPTHFGLRTASDLEAESQSDEGNKVLRSILHESQQIQTDDARESDTSRSVEFDTSSQHGRGLEFEIGI